jgi:hypothetical protein
MMLRSLPVLVSALLACTLSPAALAVDFVDTFATSANFSGAFGGTTATASGGQITLTRNTANVDAGIDWRPAGTGFFSLLEQPSFRIDATSDNSATNPGNQAGYYVITAYFFNATNDYVGESLIQGDTNATGVFSYDLAGVVATNNISGAAQWWTRVRIQPFNVAGASFSFNEFAAINPAPIPEPSSAALLLGAGMLGWISLRRRRARS